MSDYFKLGSTGYITIAFTDEDDDAVTPNSATYTLRNERTGAIINEREDVNIGSLSTSINLELLPADNTMVDSDLEEEEHVLTINFIYNTDKEGVGVYHFFITNTAASTFSDFNSYVETLLKDDSNVLDSKDFQRFIQAAFRFHNQVKPKIEVDDITGDGTYDYDLPTNYSDGFSYVKTIEFPANERIPQYIDDEDWIIYKTPTPTTQLRFINDTPSSAQTIRVTFTVQWSPNNIDEMHDNDIWPFAYLPASLCAKALSLYYSQSSDSSVDVDSVDYGDIAEKYERRSQELYNKYKVYFKLNKGTPPASILADWSPINSFNTPRMIRD